MENDTYGLAGFALGLALVIAGASWGGYVIGKHVERTDLTAALKAQIEEIYREGRADGLKTCDDVIDKQNNQGRY